MSGESSTGFPSFHRQQGTLFNPVNNSNAVSSGCDMISMGNYYNIPAGSLNLSPAESPQTSLGLKHDTGLAVEWSVEEQYQLEEGLAKYANEPNIMRYIKIAASLRDKTVRDVALRCRWMTRKRRKQEDPSLAKKAKDRKEKLSESYLNNNIYSSLSRSEKLPYSITSSYHNQGDSMLSGVMSGSAKHLLEENNQALGQISENLSTLKLHQNIDLFLHTRNNLTSIMNDMKNTPGIMSQMPPLPVFLNEELANSVFQFSSQNTMFGSSSMIPLKQEPGC